MSGPETSDTQTLQDDGAGDAAWTGRVGRGTCQPCGWGGAPERWCTASRGL